MSVAPVPTSPPVVRGPALRSFTVDEYHQMILAGILKEDDPVELLEGWIRFKMPRNPRHDAVIDATQRALIARLPDRRVRVQSAITMQDSEPEPDVVVAIGPARQYVSRHPSPADISLVVEVAESSLEYDRIEKGRAYARAGIPTYWIINLRDSAIEVYTAPSGPQDVPEYRNKVILRADESVPVTGSELAIPISELLLFDN